MGKSGISNKDFKILTAIVFLQWPIRVKQSISVRWFWLLGETSQNRKTNEENILKGKFLSPRVSHTDFDMLGGPKGWDKGPMGRISA